MEKQASQTSLTTKEMQMGFTDRSLLCLHKDNCLKPSPFQYRAYYPAGTDRRKEAEGSFRGKLSLR